MSEKHSETLRRATEGIIAVWLQSHAQLGHQHIDVLDPSRCAAENRFLGAFDIRLQDLDSVDPTFLDQVLNRHAGDQIVGFAVADSLIGNLMTPGSVSGVRQLAHSHLWPQRGLNRNQVGQMGDIPSQHVEVSESDSTGMIFACGYLVAKNKADGPMCAPTSTITLGSSCCTSS